MLRVSFRELGGVGLWYCEGVPCALVARGVWGYAPLETIYVVESEAILDH